MQEISLLQSVQTENGGHPTFFLIGLACSVLGSEADGAWSWSLTRI